jgi:hypothetical protein
MNERIQELEKQAWEFVDKTWNWANANNPSQATLFKTKFAELIVRECAKIVEDSTWNLPHGYKTVDQANLVKQHFGVEE